MAEKKPQSKQSGPPPTRGGGMSGRAQQQQRGSQQKRQANAAYPDEYEDALTGAEIFVGNSGRRKAHPLQGNQRPRFVAQYKPAADLYKAWFQRPEAWIRKTQEQLFRAGYYGNAKRNEINWGDKNDPDSVRAWASLLSETALTNKRGTDISHTDYLSQRIKYLETNGIGPDQAGSQGEGDAAPPPFRFQPSQSADELRRTLKDGMTDIIGRSLSDAETDAIVQKFMAAELAAAKSAYGVNISETGGVAAASPDFNTTAMSEVERLYPDEVKAKKMANLSKLFLAGIQSGGVDRTF